MSRVSAGVVRPKKKEDADERRCLGRSRGGLNTKVHAAVDAQGHMVSMKLSPGQDGDGPHGRELLAEFSRGPIEHVLADTAYDGDETRAQVKRLKAKACIKPHKRRTRTKRYDKERYKHRNLVERFFGRSKQFRRVATRYEKMARNFVGFVWLAALIMDVL
ncbi:IS5 family transposase [Planctomyces sp. SH-PL14]|uniref:IS5 family transposase n=1 Tax=Planctomyces sp. SH-PL14 TaxID=1632864 RepID=UPI00078D2D29|nr:IS5 family transposase [Planctomyces sp. SH-PL14]AMV16408.1 Transposase DDE domain protein [Planctomyces sp. SH-PL14]